MSEQKRRGLSQLADMLQIYLQQEIPDLMKEMTSALPPSCRDPLSLLAKVDITGTHASTHAHAHKHTTHTDEHMFIAFCITQCVLATTAHVSDPLCCVCVLHNDQELDTLKRHQLFTCQSKPQANYPFVNLDRSSSGSLTLSCNFT